MEVFTGEWSAACCERLNESEAYRAAAAGWEEPTVLVMKADEAAGVPEERAVFLDLYHGQCRGTRLATDEDRGRAVFVLTGAPAAWGEVLRGETDPIAALMRGKLRLEKGSLFALAKYAGAAKELVAVAASVGGRLPSPSA